MASYSAAKHGVVGLTRSAALDIAAFVAFLLSDEARFVTDAALAIDGGLTAA